MLNLVFNYSKYYEWLLQLTIPKIGKPVIPEFEIAINAALEAGKEILKIYNSDFSSKMKDDNSPITEADLKSNKIIKESKFLRTIFK